MRFQAVPSSQEKCQWMVNTLICTLLLRHSALSFLCAWHKAYVFLMMASSWSSRRNCGRFSLQIPTSLDVKKQKDDEMLKRSYTPKEHSSMTTMRESRLIVSDTVQLKAESPSLDALCGKPAEKRGLQCGCLSSLVREAFSCLSEHAWHFCAVENG